MDDNQESLLQKITDLHDQISNLESLEPSEDTNHLFTQLVLTCLSPITIDIRNLPRKIQETRSNLIRLCSEAESLLESHYAKIISSFDNPIDNLHVFPYYSNYLKLCHQEFTILKRHQTHAPKKVAFVGSGPLPLTSILLATKYLTNTVFHNFDLSSIANLEAVRLVTSHLDLSQRMVFHSADILDVTNDLKDFDVVILAALVGMNREEKIKIIEHLAKYMAPNSILMLRSANGARAFLYPIVEPCDLRGFETLSVFHPTDDVINSVVIARKYSTRPSQKGFGPLLMPCKFSGEIKACDLLKRKGIVGQISSSDS
nr:PREDICTED: nicotianamine synthase-like [Bemisia tabaci]XP_018918125.1 PREDICTED: nicotianamine synthase-like [Bemisia tabaci]